MRKLTLGARLILGGIIVVLVPLVIIGLFANLKASSALTEVSEEQAANVAAKLADMAQVALSRDLKLAKELSLEKTTIETAVKVAKNKTEESAAEIERLNRHLSNIMK